MVVFGVGTNILRAAKLPDEGIWLPKLTQTKERDAASLRRTRRGCDGECL